ncbi:hypothetical protein HYC85_029082 [Camellia sinensis]|uniref:Uncharacterized protein n=1 Tax=Camellia sinensis TaxID=4442 RepID=A0A7J7FY60_CAMSI|nr:hypothetical protein HYC85_029082 [Camellia sinensis]
MPCKASPHITGRGQRPPAEAGFGVFGAGFKPKRDVGASFVKVIYKGEKLPFYSPFLHCFSTYLRAVFVLICFVVWVCLTPPKPCKAPFCAIFVQVLRLWCLSLFTTEILRDFSGGDGLSIVVWVDLGMRSIAPFPCLALLFQKSISQNNLPDLDSLVQIKNRDTNRLCPFWRTRCPFRQVWFLFWQFRVEVHSGVDTLLLRSNFCQGRPSGFSTLRALFFFSFHFFSSLLFLFFFSFSFRLFFFVLFSFLFFPFFFLCSNFCLVRPSGSRSHLNPGEWLLFADECRSPSNQDLAFLLQKGLSLEAESDPMLYNLKINSRKRLVTHAEDNVEPIWIKPGSFSVLILTNMISFIKGLTRLSFSQLIEFLQIPRNSSLFVFITAQLAPRQKQTQKKECKRQTQNKIVMSEVTPPKSPYSNTTGLTRYNKIDSIQHNKTDPIPKSESKITSICTLLKTCDDDLVINQILYFVAKTKTHVSVMTGLLMEGIALGSIMLSWKGIRERPRLKGFEMALSYKDLVSFGRGHVEGIKDPLALGLVLQGLWSCVGSTSKGIGRIGVERGVSGTTFFLPACPLIQTALILSGKSVIHSLCNNYEHLLFVQPFDFQSLNSLQKVFMGTNACPYLVLAICLHFAKGLAFFQCSLS